MNVLPVITRELRVQARQPFTFRLRMAAVLALVGTSGIFLWDNPGAHNIGGLLFALMHCVLFYSALVLVTFSGADTLSSERREGTLGLLFLTPLAATDIVIAKGIAQGLRSLTLILAVLPVFALPLLLGGVSWSQLISAFLLLLTAIALALGAAFLASAWSKRWTRAQAAALFIVILGWVGLTACLGAMLFIQFARSNTNFSFRGSFDYAWLMAISIVSGGVSRWNWFARSAASSANVPMVAQVAGLALVWLLGCIWLAARHTRKVWREEPPSAGRQWVERKLTTPIVGLQFYKHWMRRLLDRNPVGWLQRRAWQGRLVMWSWLAIVITVTTSTLGDGALIRVFGEMQRMLSWLLVLSVAATVAGSFRRERETGVMELLLISSLSARRIILGRLLGLWGQFLPAVVLFVFIWAYISKLLRDYEAVLGILSFLVMFATVPVIGLYFSLRCRSFIGAFLMALIIGVGLPVICGRLITWIMEMEGVSSFYTGESLADAISGLLPVCVLQVALAAFYLLLTHQRLERRQFAFERSQA